MGNIKHFVPKLMTQSQTTDAFIEHVLTLRAHLPDNGMVRYALFRSTGYNLICYAPHPAMYVLEMSTNCDKYSHHMANMIISCTRWNFTNDCDRMISWGMFLAFMLLRAFKKLFMNKNVYHLVLLAYSVESIKISKHIYLRSVAQSTWATDTECLTVTM